MLWLCREMMVREGGCGEGVWGEGNGNWFNGEVLGRDEFEKGFLGGVERGGGGGSILLRV